MEKYTEAYAIRLAEFGEHNSKTKSIAKKIRDCSEERRRRQQLPSDEFVSTVPDKKQRSSWNLKWSRSESDRPFQNQYQRRHSGGAAIPNTVSAAHVGGGRSFRSSSSELEHTNPGFPNEGQGLAQNRGRGHGGAPRTRGSGRRPNAPEE